MQLLAPEVIKKTQFLSYQSDLQVIFNTLPGLESNPRVNGFVKNYKFIEGWDGTWPVIALDSSQPEESRSLTSSFSTTRLDSTQLSLPHLNVTFTMTFQ